MNKKENIDLQGQKRLRSILSSIENLEIKWVSSAYWNVDEKWDLNKRELDDLFLFLPLEGHAQVYAEDQKFELNPGTIWWVDEHVIHGGQLINGCQRMKVLAFHLHLQHRSGGNYRLKPSSGTFRLSEAWTQRLFRLAWLEQENPQQHLSFLHHEMISLLMVILSYGSLELKAPEEMDHRIRELIDWLETERTNIPSLQECSRKIGLSSVHLRNLFQNQIGQNPHDYILKQRLGWAKEKLLTTSISVAKIAREYGFASPQQFHRAFKKIFLCTPKELKNTEQGQI